MKRIIKINIEVEKMDRAILDDLIAFADKLNKTKEERPYSNRKYLFNAIVKEKFTERN